MAIDVYAETWGGFRFEARPFGRRGRWEWSLTREVSCAPCLDCDCYAHSDHVDTIASGVVDGRVAVEQVMEACKRGFAAFEEAEGIE